MTRPPRVTGIRAPQPGGFLAFIPHPLPPTPPVTMPRERIRLAVEAQSAVASLDVATDLLPDPDRFVYSYVRREAVLSSEIEGTQSSLDELIRREAGAEVSRPNDAREVSNYVAALNEALDALSSVPVSSRLIRDVHRRLMQDTRGAMRTPGEFRQHQVHIGAEGTGIGDAVFVPPPADAVEPAIAALERYIHAEETEEGDPPLIRIGLAHAQFETIHPFWDGNGRCGRLLISLLLAETGLLRRPVLYLSAYFRQHRSAYYDHLQATRDSGDFEGWIDFFLRGVVATARDATGRARQIVALREAHRTLIADRLGSSAGKAFRLLDQLYRRPFTTISAASEFLGVSFPTASRLVEAMQGLGILDEITGHRHSRIFMYQSYVDIFSVP